MIVGTWTVSQISFTSIEDNQVVADYDVPGQDWLFCFKSNRTGWVKNPPDSIPYSYTITDNDLILKVQIPLDGLRKSHGYEELAYKIDQLDENKLVLAEETVWHDVEVIYRLHMSKI